MSSARVARHYATLLRPILLRVAASAALTIAGWLLVLMLAPPAASASGIDLPDVDQQLDGGTSKRIAATVDETTAAPADQPTTPAAGVESPSIESPSAEPAGAEPTGAAPTGAPAPERDQSPSQTAAPDTGPVALAPVRTAVREVADVGQTALRHVGQVTGTLGTALGGGDDRGDDESDVGIPLPLPDLGGLLPDDDASLPPDVEPAPDPIRNVPPPPEQDTAPATPEDAANPLDAVAPAQAPASPGTPAPDTHPRPTNSTTATAQPSALTQRHQLNGAAPTVAPARLAPASHDPAGNVPAPAPSHPDSTGAITAQHSGADPRHPLAVLGAECAMPCLPLAETTIDQDTGLARDKAALPATAPD